MNAKNIFKNLTILLVFTIGFLAIYSFTPTNNEANDLSTYDASYYQDIDTNNTSSSFTITIESDEKCGDGRADGEPMSTDGKYG